uniref:Mercuric reductase (Hg(II) reductase) n=1 Tax=mine drainage metagenome TaxID=410659 RepID=E6QFQ5_9ZZZZ
MPGVRSTSVSYPQRQAEIKVDANVGLDSLVAAVAALGSLTRRTSLPVCWTRRRAGRTAR